jgi:SPX domain protein involved in polyphosphate accumulation
MKNINYFNKKLKDNIDLSKELTQDDYEIKQISIEIEDKDVDYYLDIINKSYGEFGKVTTEEGQTPQPTEIEQLKQHVVDLENYILQRELQDTTA